MLLLSSAYRRLGLCWAAKYYAFGAAFIAHRADDDNLKPLFVAALHEIALCNYAAGEWISFSEMIPLILSMHYQYLDDPDNWEEHEKLQATIYHFYVARASSKALSGESAVTLMNTPLADVTMPEYLRNDILTPPLDLSHIETFSSTKVREAVQQDLFGVPLCDTGPTRSRFQQWVATHRADGRKDWWILLVLMNTIVNYRARMLTGGRDVPAMEEYLSKAIHEDESADAIEFPEEILYGEEMKMSTAIYTFSTARTWNLKLRSQTPDIDAIERLLKVRYRQNSDDVEHADPFRSSSVLED